jgi:hypothetical protein
MSGFFNNQTTLLIGLNYPPPSPLTKTPATGFSLLLRWREAGGRCISSRPQLQRWWAWPWLDDEKIDKLKTVQNPFLTSFEVLLRALVMRAGRAAPFNCSSRSMGSVSSGNERGRDGSCSMTRLKQKLHYSHLRSSSRIRWEVPRRSKHPNKLRQNAQQSRCARVLAVMTCAA